ncbi:MAG: response regulator [Gammaproteobacteria bacterium]|nr:response regulator [Gammaproteobacteria bacterium]
MRPLITSCERRCNDVRILIVDDHAIVRVGLKQILMEDRSDFEFGEAASASEAFKQLAQHDWDLMLLDINLPAKNGIEILKQLRSNNRQIPVLVLSMYPEDQYAIRALKAGASGYMTKEMAPENLLDAIMKVANGGRYVSPELAEQLAKDIQAGGSAQPHSLLTDREFEIFKLIASGNTVSEIGLELSLSVKTVSTYRTRILSKMNLKHNADITQYAVKHQLV